MTSASSRGCLLLLVLASALLPAQNTLPGTSPLTFSGDPASEMVLSINKFLLQETEAAAERRSGYWKRDFSSREAYERSIAPNRERLRRIIGSIESRVPVDALSLETTTEHSAELARGGSYKVYAVRWPVFSDVSAEGLLLQPDREPRARVVAIPDADWSPEMFSGLEGGVPRGAQIARRLVENGCQVLVPVLIDRASTWSGIPGIRMTNQPHREWIYRMAFEAGRHIIGYEVQKVLAAVDWFARENSRKKLPVGVAGYGEGGLLALYSAALDTRIDTALVSGYFGPREELWKEPIYRNVWGLLREFGDGELAAMIAPRVLVVEASAYPPVHGPPPETSERKGAAPVGELVTPPLDRVKKEVERARPSFEALEASDHLTLAGSGNGPPGSSQSLPGILDALGIGGTLADTDSDPDIHRRSDISDRLHRQFNQLVEHTQAVIRSSGQNRQRFWSRADSTSPAQWQSSTEPLKDYIWTEVIGRMPQPDVPVNARTRLLYDRPLYRGYEVMLDVWPGIYAQGILLVPKEIRPAERRPVVVCQHGLEGRPADVGDPDNDNHYYHRFAVRLAEQGFVTFAPQNPYIGEDTFRRIQRIGHPLKLSIFSFVLGQHSRLLDWLGTLPFVDAKRIGFYGLSYGGKTAVRVPPLLSGYALSICSADFNEWVWKTTSTDAPYSYMLTREYDMLEFDFANIVNYSDLANLMAPRPFMVERGHDDGVAPDEWVAYEYAKVRRFYAKLGLADRTEIEFFNGPHTIHGVGTFAFLKRHLKLD